MTYYSATYDPQDDKLRLSATSRLDKEEYERVKAAGFSWAPKQQVFYAAWTPEREDLMHEMCGEIGDEDTTLVDRAEQRAERFEGYSDNRAEDARRAREAVSAIADNIPLGQPILVGHHSERHARRDAEKIKNGMRRAVKMWETSEYWQQRATAALRHAKYLERPDVRARRIKTLEADFRKCERNKEQAEKSIKAWSIEPMTHKLARLITNTEYISMCFPLDRYPRNPPISQYEGSMGLWSALGDTPELAIITPEQARDIAIPIHERIIEQNERWISHLNNRIAYERAMLGEQGGLVGEQFDYQVGGRILRRGEWYPITRVNKVRGKINSVTVAGISWGAVTLDEIKDYRPPSEEDAAKVKAAVKLPPLCNYPGEGFLHQTKAEYEKTVPKWSDFPKIKTISATDKYGAHRVKHTREPGKEWYHTIPVFLTDAKVVEPPKPAPKPEPLAIERDYSEIPTPTYRDPKPVDPEAQEFAAMAESLKAGVQVVSAPQLFPTPRELAARMVELAEVQPEHRVLEPSAGTGRLVDALDAVPGAEVVAVEINPSLADRTRLRSNTQHRVICADFLECDGDLGKFDRVLMNPPFADGADVEHVRHAYDMLKPGGKLVAVMCNGPFFREDRKSADFRAWLDEVGGESEKLPADTFKESGTGVNTRLVIISKPPPAASEFIPEAEAEAEDEPATVEMISRELVAAVNHSRTELERERMQLAVDSASSRELRSFADCPLFQNQMDLF